ncbi:MAG: polysaccharide biosynthesis/export family protein [Planctomycetia bacterium]|nr:polysaccharide biosynthesis/export family protein [Planctomycetia bacterium]
MGHSRRARLPVRWQVTAGFCTIGLGWSLGVAEPAFAQQPGRLSYASQTLTVRATVLWTIESAEAQPAAMMQGESDVGPDGTLSIGPYGNVSVAGLSLGQAQFTVQRHLARYLKQPRVTLSLATTGHPPTSGPLVTVGRVVPIGDHEPIEEPVPIFVPDAILEPVSAAPEVDLPLPGGQPAASDWRPLARPGQPLQSANFQDAPMFEPAPAAVQAPPEPQPMELKIYPKKLPKSPDDDGKPEPGPETAGKAPGVETMMAGTGMPLDMVKPLPLPPTPHEHARVTLPPYIIDPPDVLIIESGVSLRDQPIRGQHLVRPDGTINLGIYGPVYVTGLTLDAAKDAIARQLAGRIRILPQKDDPEFKELDLKKPVSDIELIKKVLSVDVLAYNSKYYYVITDGGGFGEQVTRFPITGNETVLDAISQISGLPPVASKKHITVARTVHGGHGQQVLPVDWVGITQHGQVRTNYQIMPNDRVYVKAQKLVTVDTALARFLSPIERIFGITLLGSSTVNSIRTNGQNNNNNNFGQ